MKKKIRDLTIQEILDIHDDEDFEGCDSCPFADTPLCGGIIHNKHLGDVLDEEVEIKEMEDLEQIDNTNHSEVSESLKKVLNRVFGYGVQSTLDNLLSRGYNTKDMLEQKCLGNSLEEDLDEARTKINDLYIVKQLLLKAQEQDKILEKLKKPMFYSERKKLGEEYLEWARENNVAQNDLTSIITWCFCFKMKEWLNNGNNL